MRKEAATFVAASSFSAWGALEEQMPTPIVREAYGVFAGHVCQMHCRPCADGEPWTLPAKAGKDCRFVIRATADDRESADKLFEVCG